MTTTAVNPKFVLATIMNAQRVQNEGESIESIFGANGSLKKMLKGYSLKEAFLEIKENPEALYKEASEPKKEERKFNADKFLSDVEAYLIETGELIVEGIEAPEDVIEEVVHEDEVQKEEVEILPEINTPDVTETVETQVEVAPEPEQEVVVEEQVVAAEEPAVETTSVVEEDSILARFEEIYEELEAGKEIFDTKEEAVSMKNHILSLEDWKTWAYLLDKEISRFEKEEEASIAVPEPIIANKPVEEVTVDILQEKFGSFAEVKAPKLKALKPEKPVENIELPKHKVVEVSDTVKKMIANNIAATRKEVSKNVSERILPVGDERVLEVVKKNFRNSRNLPFNEASANALWRAIVISTKKTDGQKGLTFHNNTSLYNRDQIVPAVAVAIGNNKGIAIDPNSANIGIHQNNFDYSPFAPSDKFPKEVNVSKGKITFEERSTEFIEGIVFSAFSLGERKGRDEKFTVLNGKKDFQMRNAFIIKKTESLMGISVNGKEVFSLVGQIGNFKIYIAN